MRALIRIRALYTTGSKALQVMDFAVVSMYENLTIEKRNMYTRLRVAIRPRLRKKKIIILFTMNTFFCCLIGLLTPRLLPRLL